MKDVRELYSGTLLGSEYQCLGPKRAESRCLIGSTFTAKLAEGGISWLFHEREVTASKGPGREGDGAAYSELDV